MAFADKIFLNKTDLVMLEEGTALKARLATINKFDTIIETQKSRAPLEKILGLNTFNMESILSYNPEFFDEDEDNKKSTILI